MDEEAAHKALDEYEVKHIEENEGIKSLIASTNSSYKEITIGDVRIRVKRYMPKKVRAQALRIGRQLEEATHDDLDQVERGMYPIVAAMCVDEPYSKPATWEYIDERTGIIQDVVFKILEEVNKTDESVKTFRPKR